ncbi:MAG: hypothetical protein ABL997_06185 [Planctomycetota bacterium]
MNNNHAICGAFLAFLPLSLAHAQCPDQGRTKIEKAGKSNSTTRNCATFTLSIGVVTVTSPAQCEDSFVWRDADEFGCGGSLPGYCCDPNDHRVNIKIYGPSNTCPQPPAALPGSVEEAFNIINCGTPKLTRQTYNNSAKCKECKTPECDGLPSAVGEPAHGEDTGDYIAWYGNPDNLLPAADPSVVAGWGSALENMPASELPDLMRQVWLSCAPIECAVGLEASVERAQVDSEGITRYFSYDVQGSAAADGRFLLSSTSDYEANGQIVPTTFDLSYDHKALYRGAVGSPFYAAFPQSRADFKRHFETIFAEVLPLLDWVRGPCCIPLRSDIAWDSSPSVVDIDGVSVPVVQVVETYPTLGLTGSRVYDIDASGMEPRVLRIRTVDSAGNTLQERLFREHAEIAPGTTRPMVMTTRLFYAGSTTPHDTTTLKVGQMRIATVNSVPSWRRGSNLAKWYVFK